MRLLRSWGANPSMVLWPSRGPAPRSGPRVRPSSLVIAPSGFPQGRPGEKEELVKILDDVSNRWMDRESVSGQFVITCIITLEHAVPSW